MPICTKTVIVWPECKFFYDELSLAKRDLCKHEQQKKHSGLTVHSQMFDTAAKSYQLECTAAKSAYYNSLILEAPSQRAVFKIAPP